MRLLIVFSEPHEGPSSVLTKDWFNLTFAGVVLNLHKPIQDEERNKDLFVAAIKWKCCVAWYKGARIAMQLKNGSLLHVNNITAGSECFKETRDVLWVAQMC